MPERRPITYPAPVYGPTELYGRCEVDACSATARVTCPDCGADVCLGHAEHEAHAQPAPANPET